MLLQRRWVAGHLLVLVFAGAFIALGLWQLGRHHHKQQLVREARAAYAAPAPDLTAGSSFASGQPAQARGTFDGAHEAILRDQPHGDQTGSDVAAPPSGPVVVRGVLADSRALSAQDSVETLDGRVSVPRVDLTRLSGALGHPLRNLWLQARYIAPNVADAPVLPQPPPPDQVNHLQYTYEWFALALIPILGWPIVLVRSRRKRGRTRNGSPADRAPVHS
jgi:cytochrome oxidase assembly protein ShyY1